MILNEEEIVVAEVTDSSVPTEFLTGFVGECWSRIGDLKSMIDSISTTYTKDDYDIVSIMQGLVDAYLIAAGQIENRLAKTGDLANNEVQKVDEPVVQVTPVVADIENVVETEPVITAEEPEQEPEQPVDETPVEEPEEEIESNDINDEPKRIA